MFEWASCPVGVKHLIELVWVEEERGEYNYTYNYLWLYNVGEI